MLDAATDSLLPHFQTRLGLAANALDLDRVRSGEADAVEYLSNARAIDGTAVPDGREVPLFEAAAVVFEMDISHQVLHFLELIARIGASVVIGDIARVEIKADVRVVDVFHQGQHGKGVLRRPLVSLQREGHAAFAGNVAELAQMRDGRLAFTCVGRLSGAQDANLGGEPPRREPDALLGELEPSLGADVGPAHVAATDLDPVTI